MGHFYDALSHIRRSKNALIAEQIYNELLAVKSDFGLNALPAGTEPDPKLSLAERKKHVLLCGRPVDWLERYVARNNAAITTRSTAT